MISSHWNQRFWFESRLAYMYMEVNHGKMTWFGISSTERLPQNIKDPYHMFKLFMLEVGYFPVRHMQVPLWQCSLAASQPGSSRTVMQAQTPLSAL